MTKGLAGLLTEVPNGFTYCPNRKIVGKWSQSFDDAHCSNGPAMAKYYGLVCRQVLESERWYNLNVQCSATTDLDWREPWLLAQCFRDPARSEDRAQGLQKVNKEDPGYKIVPHEARIKRGIANGEVSFLRPRTGGDFYLTPGRKHTLTFGRPYQIQSDTPPKEATFPAKFDLTGTIVRGDGQAAKDVTVTLADRSTKTDAAGRFTFAGLTGNPVETPLIIGNVRSEERRVGEEGRSRWSP